jgi:hypothetical protein
MVSLNCAQRLPSMDGGLLIVLERGTWRGSVQALAVVLVDPQHSGGPQVTCTQPSAARWRPTRRGRSSRAIDSHAYPVDRAPTQTHSGPTPKQILSLRPPTTGDLDERPRQPLAGLAGPLTREAAQPRVLVSRVYPMAPISFGCLHGRSSLAQATTRDRVGSPEESVRRAPEPSLARHPSYRKSLIAQNDARTADDISAGLRLRDL